MTLRRVALDWRVWIFAVLVILLGCVLPHLQGLRLRGMCAAAPFQIGAALPSGNRVAKISALSFMVHTRHGGRVAGSTWGWAYASTHHTWYLRSARAQNMTDLLGRLGAAHERAELLDAPNGPFIVLPADAAESASGNPQLPYRFALTACP